MQNQRCGARSDRNQREVSDHWVAYLNGGAHTVTSGGDVAGGFMPKEDGLGSGAVSADDARRIGTQAHI